ncbi:hypothetical protein QUB47_17080 [Microcoleus sp. AT9_B5]
MNCALNFKPGQIVSIECGDACLHSELIQVVEARQVCWVRPLMLVVSGASQFGKYIKLKVDR